MQVRILPGVLIEPRRAATCGGRGLRLAEKVPLLILNAYAVLAAFLGLLRLGFGLLVLALGVRAWHVWGRGALTPEGRKALEDRCYLLFSLALLLVVLNVLSWPLLYLVLQSYVPEWPGVMCIYGVTQVGAGSVGPARWLPRLLTALQLTKPALVFVSGAWVTLYLLNRSTRTAPLTGRVVGVLLGAGLLVVADAAAELAYLAIPKKEEFLSVGCCTEAFDLESGSSRFLPQALLGEHAVPWLYAAYYAVNLGMAGALFAVGRRGRLPGAALVPLLLGAVLSVVVNALFLIEVAAPRLLHLPFHHCPYDLVPDAPESLVAVALFVAGSFAVGWACVASWLGRSAETAPYLPRAVGRLLRAGFLCYLASLAMLSVELALA